MLLFVLFRARIWAADGWFLFGVELINGLELVVEFCEAAMEAADKIFELLMLLLIVVDVEIGREI